MLKMSPEVHGGKTMSINQKEPRFTNVFIAIMGVAGVGKSTFISKPVGDQITLGHEPALMHTRDDTPGFNDTNRTDFHVLQAIASFPKISFQDGLRLNGMACLHPISDNRFQLSIARSMSMLRKIVGGSVYPNIILATTKRESIAVMTNGEKRARSLISDTEFWSAMKQEGCQVRRHCNTDASARKLVSFFVEEKTNKVTLELQEDLVSTNKDLIDTAAGQEARGQYTAAIEEQQRELREIKEQLQEVKKDRTKDTDLMGFLGKREKGSKR
ncbi:MAG: hypothetical protein Q9226_007074 [Calogaya cf. arnoldii]